MRNWILGLTAAIAIAPSGAAAFSGGDNTDRVEAFGFGMCDVTYWVNTDAQVGMLALSGMSRDFFSGGAYW